MYSRQKILPPGASVRDFGTAVGTSIFKIKGWKNTPILKISPPDADNDYEVTWLDDRGCKHINSIRAKELNKRKVIIARHFSQKIDQDVWQVEKQHINRVLSQLVEYFQPTATTKVIVLDHYSLTTSTMLAALHIPPTHIFVPNPDPVFLSRVPKNKTKLATIVNQTLFDFLNTVDSEREMGHFHCFFDYCCTFTGGAKCLPTLDLHQMFYKTLLPKYNGILWLTFSVRAVAGGAAALLQTVQGWLNMEALAFDYALTLAYHRAYGTVLTMIFVTGRENGLLDFSSFCVES